MYRAFNVTIEKVSEWANYADKYGYNVLQFCYEDNLKQLINSSSKISADKIKELLMPVEHHDIFISHSHKDLELAKGLAGYLKKEFGLSCFIDSLYWGNIDELQEELNRLHKHKDATNGKEYFDYQSTMEVAKHANMILASALTQMIDECECVFFLNTDNSVIRGSDAINGNETYSPWIYHEVFTTSIIRRRTPTERILNENFYIRDSAVSRLPQVFYNLDLTGMAKIDYFGILLWSMKSKSNPDQFPLDVLYKIFPEQK